MDICNTTNTDSLRLYMRCSTYVKLGAREIAHNENMVLKRAVKFNEFDDLDSEMDHFDPSLLDMFKIINTASNTSSVTTTTTDLYSANILIHQDCIPFPWYLSTTTP